MLAKGMHPTIIAESFLKASAKAVEYLGEISTPVDLKDKASLLRAASTSLNSKVRNGVFMLLRVEDECSTVPPADCITIFLNIGTDCRVGCHEISDAGFI